MDNDREVDQQKPGTDLVERSKMVFLEEIVNEFRRKQQQYDLPTEFAKTGRNRSWLVPGVIVALIVIFSGVVIFVTQYIQRSSRSIQVDIQDVADVNLRDILDEAQRLQNALAVAERELEQLEREYQTAVTQVERARDRGIELLATGGLTAAQQEARAAELRAQAQNELAQLEAQYQPRIEELLARIEQLQAEIAQYDSRQLEQAREQEEILNNQQRVFDLEMEELRRQYETEIEQLTTSYEREIAELEAFQAEFERTIRARHAEEIARLVRRYNPSLSGEAVGALLNEPVDPAAQSFTDLRPYAPLLGAEGVVSAQEYDAMRADFNGVTALLDRLQAVPYENSVPGALTQIEARTRSLLSQYEDVWSGLESSVLDRDAIIRARNATIAGQQERIDQFFFALEQFSRVNGDNGYILDPRNPSEIVVYANRVVNVAAGSLGYVFRRDDEYVGTIRFESRNGRITARLVETAENQVLQAFDTIIIEAE
jgi:hypothetical protein